jgi:succinyl-CoA synthetase beta subunit
MKFYEHQAKKIYETYRIPKPDGDAVTDLKALPAVLKKLGKGPWAIKAQILAGGRGKAGGVKLVKTPAEAKEFAKGLLGKNLVTHQTGPKGEKVVALLVEKSLPKISREMYVSILLDRKLACPVLLASKTGGMDIETLAKDNPSAIMRYAIDPIEKLPLYRARLIAKDLGLTGKSIAEGAALLSRLTDLFFGIDANLVEINPLAVTEDGSLMALDGKMTTDDNALYRHRVRHDEGRRRRFRPERLREAPAAQAGGRLHRDGQR